MSQNKDALSDPLRADRQQITNRSSSDISYVASGDHATEPRGRRREAYPEFYYPCELAPKCLRDFAAMLRPVTNAPEAFIVGAGLAALGALAGANVSVSTGTKMNLFFLLVGRTSVSRKSTAQGLAIELFREVVKHCTPTGETTVIESFTVEGIQTELSENKYVLLAPDEYKVVFDVNKRQAQSNTVTTLTGLYDCKPRRARLRAQSFTALNPYVSILTCSTAKWLDDFLTASNAAGGFLNRHTIVLCNPTNRQLDEPEKVPTNQLELIAKEIARFVPSGDQEHSIGLEIKAKAVWSAYCDDLRERMKDMDDEESDTIAREEMQAWKLAGIRALFEGRKAISVEDVLFGTRWSMASSQAAMFLASQTKRNNKHQIAPRSHQQRVLDRVEKHQPVTKRQIQQHFGGAQSDWNRAIEELVKAGALILKPDGYVTGNADLTTESAS